MNPDDLVADVERHFDLTDERCPLPHVINGETYKYGSVNPRHALTTLAEGVCERWEGRGGGGGFTSIASRWIDVGKPYMQVVFAIETTGAPGTFVNWAWRVYGAAPDWRPTRAFAELLVRYGHDVRCGDRQQRLMVTEIVEGIHATVEYVDIGDDPIAYGAGIRFHSLTHGPTEVTWAWCINDRLYHDAVLAAR